MREGREMDTLGITGLDGAATVTFFVWFANGQS
jgi:hypothetical protein